MRSSSIDEHSAPCTKQISRSRDTASKSPALALSGRKCTRRREEAPRPRNARRGLLSPCAHYIPTYLPTTIGHRVYSSPAALQFHLGGSSALERRCRELFGLSWISGWPDAHAVLGVYRYICRCPSIRLCWSAARVIVHTCFECLFSESFVFM